MGYPAVSRQVILNSAAYCTPVLDARAARTFFSHLLLMPYRKRITPQTYYLPMLLGENGIAASFAVEVQPFERG